MSLWQVPLSIQRSEGVQLAVPILSDTNDKVALHQSGTALLDPGSVGGRRRRSTAVCVELLTGRVRARMPGIEANIGARREPTDSLPYSTMGWTSATRRGGHLTACLPFLPFLPWLAENARCTRRPLCVALCRSHSCPKAGGIQATFECERRCHRSAMQAVAGSPCNARRDEHDNVARKHQMLHIRRGARAATETFVSPCLRPGPFFLARHNSFGPKCSGPAHYLYER